MEQVIWNKIHSWSIQHLSSIKQSWGALHIVNYSLNLGKMVANVVKIYQGNCNLNKRHLICDVIKLFVTLRYGMYSRYAENVTYVSLFLLLCGYAEGLWEMTNGDESHRDVWVAECYRRFATPASLLPWVEVEIVTSNPGMELRLLVLGLILVAMMTAFNVIEFIYEVSGVDILNCKGWLYNSLDDNTDKPYILKQSHSSRIQIEVQFPINITKQQEVDLPGVNATALEEDNVVTMDKGVGEDDQNKLIEVCDKYYNGWASEFEDICKYTPGILADSETIVGKNYMLLLNVHGNDAEN